jgi:hypothetical protein
MRFAPRSALGVRDRVAGAAGLTIDLKKTLGLCLPTGIADASPALEPYAARVARTRPPQPRLAIPNQRVSNRFGTDELDVKGLDALLVPSSALLDPPPAPLTVPGALDAFACYEVARANGRSGPGSPAPLPLQSALGTWQFDIHAPTRLCLPADVDDDDATAPSHPTALACYRAKLARTKPPQGKPFPRGAATVNRFGSEQLTLTASVDFCVPSDASAVGAAPTATPTSAVGPTPTPTITPPPNFTLRIDPAAISVDIGASTKLKATAVFTNGDTEDFTERVIWSSSSEAIEAPNVPGERGRADAVDAGSSVISVLDLATGVTSTTTGDDAIVTVNATLERLELQPATITRGIGESFRLRAVAHFAGGYTHSVAKRVIYASSDPTVGQPTNDVVPSEHARVLALAEGTTMLSATDPISGVTSTASGDDVTLTVVPPLDHCAILNLGPLTLAVDHEYQLTARGFYPGGFERNLTQQVVWSSADPAVLEAPNAEGDRSRVRALFPGDVQVTATDSVTGTPCDNAVTFQVRGQTGLSVYTSADYLAGRPRRVGDSWHLRAVQFLDGPPYYKYVTEKVVFSSSNPAAVSAPNTPGNRGRIDAVGSGTAQVVATDPATGQTSGPVTLRGLDGLTSIEVLHRKSDGGFFPIQLGWIFGLTVEGQFADGPERLEADDFTVASSNPSVVEALPPNAIYYGALKAVGYGSAMVSATDTRTGISSDDSDESILIGVLGPVRSIELVPADARRRVGGVQAFTAIAHYEGGLSDNVTQRLFYSSSNPAIASALNQGGNASAVHTLAPGTVRIDGLEFASGYSTSMSGGGANLTVVGPLVRLRVEPNAVSRSVGRSVSFTAIGTDADGREINLTQAVTWSSSNPAVAVATNDEGNRSRVFAVKEGTATISAFDPEQGLSSGASGDDATLTVSGILERLTLSAERTTLAVGEPIQVTATGHLIGGTTVNLTQEVIYTSSAPAIVNAENAAGDRSRVVAVAPGTAVISAVDPGTKIATGAAETVTITVSAP